MVLPALLSVVQAHALEWLRSHMSARDDRDESSLAANSAWRQVAAGQIGTIFRRLVYSTMVMHFRRVASARYRDKPMQIGQPRQ